MSDTQFRPDDTIKRGSLAVTIRKREQLKANETVLISYQSLQGKEVEVKFEYENSKEYIVITNDNEKLVLTFTTLRQVATTVLLKVTDDRNEVFYFKKSLRLRYPNELLTMTTITDTTELESVQFAI